MAPAAAIPSFHIAVDGPYPSFASSELQQGDPEKITLAMVRYRCRISNKLFFTADGKTSVKDATSLSYYMSLTAEGAKILNQGTAHKASGAHDEDKKTSEKKDQLGEAKEDSSQAPAILTLNIKVADGKSEVQPRVLPGANEALSDLLDQVSAGGLERGALPTFSDRALQSLSTDYRTLTGSVKFPEPSDLTEQQWGSVLVDNRTMHGYWYDYEQNVITKANKPAFRLLGAAPVGEAPTEGKKDQAQLYIPPTPPFYIQDDASVSVHEIKNQFQQNLAKQGFNSTGVSGSLGGGAKIPISITASYDQENAWANQSRVENDVNALVVTYNFPRVVIELEPEVLELTDQCRLDALNVTSADEKKEFFREYGNVFATRFTLGGYLHSTRSVASKGKSTLDQFKDQTRVSAGLSFQTPKVSGSLNVANVNSSSQEAGTASLFQESRLTWDAHGGDTLLCSNGPPAWANTVKNPRLWRLMNQERIVGLEFLIKDVDNAASEQLANPSSTGRAVGDDMRDSVRRGQAQDVLLEALNATNKNAIIKRIKAYYQRNSMETSAGIEPYNKFIQEIFPDEETRLIEANTLFGGLSRDQKLSLGLYLASKRVIRI